MLSDRLDERQTCIDLLRGDLSERSYAEAQARPTRVLAFIESVALPEDVVKKCHYIASKSVLSPLHIVKKCLNY